MVLFVGLFFFSEQSVFRHLQLNDLQMTAGPLSACPPLQSETQAEWEFIKLEGAGMCWAPGEISQNHRMV